MNEDHMTPPKGTKVGRYLIYGLIDPRDGSLRYVGKTHKRRELRLAEHIERALKGRTAPVYQWIRELNAAGLAPEIFVLERVAADQDWKLAERRAIALWREWSLDKLPHLHVPQTSKSRAVLIRRVHLLNVREGG